jgi:hypothetical protein
MNSRSAVGGIDEHGERNLRPGDVLLDRSRAGAGTCLPGPQKKLKAHETRDNFRS